MKKVLHRSTKTEFEIIREGVKVVIMKVAANPNNVPGLKVGMVQKTTPACILNQFDIL